jgi:hypothetical protein
MEVADHALPAAVAAELDGGDAFGQWHAVLSWRMEHRGCRPIRLAPDFPVSPDPELRAPAGPQRVQVHEGVVVGAGQGCLLSQSAPFLSRKLDPRSTCGGGSRGGDPPSRASAIAALPTARRTFSVSVTISVSSSAFESLARSRPVKASSTSGRDCPVEAAPRALGAPARVPRDVVDADSPPSSGIARASGTASVQRHVLQALGGARRARTGSDLCGLKGEREGDRGTSGGAFSPRTVPGPAPHFLSQQRLLDGDASTDGARSGMF